METRASYVLIGAFALGIFLAAFGFVLWLGKLSLEREWVYYDIVFEEAVTGLTVGGAVQYNGIQVGEVRKLSLAPADPRKVIAHVRLNAGTPVKVDTRARLNLVGLTGVTIIQLSGGTPQAPALEPTAGETVARIVADVSAMQSLLASGQDVALSANEALLRVGRLLSDDNIDRVADTLRNIDDVTQALAANRQDLHRIVADVASASRQLSRTLAGIERLSASTDDTLNRRLRPLLDAAQRAVDEAAGQLESNREPIARFTADGLAQLTATVVELRATLRTLRAVSSRLQEDPSGYVLGRERPREFVPR